LLVLVEAEKALVLARQKSIRILQVYIPTGENILADAASRFQEIPDWHLHSFVFQAIAARWGLPMIVLFASNASKQTTLLQLGRLRQPRRSSRPVPEVGLHSRVRLPSYRSPQKNGEEAGDVERHLHPGFSPLGSPDMASVASDIEGPGGSPPAFHGRLSDGSDDWQAAPDPSQPPSSRLKDLWRINSLRDLPGNTKDILKAGWHQST
jgi:hypothetical protein